MDAQTARKILKIENQIGELASLESFLEGLGEEWDLSFPLIMSINLALEEALTNTISYGYDDRDTHTIEISFGKSETTLTIVITDDGHPYDPTLKADPDITLAAEDRPIGGLGIYLIKKIMDKVVYERAGNKNHLILTKILEQ
jgi:anti-sigma regulatory factor (Ser/Thr protein kinase)